MACSVAGHLTAVNEHCASQLSKHSTVNDSPECVLLCQSPSFPSEKLLSTISLVISQVDQNNKNKLDKDE